MSVCAYGMVLRASWEENYRQSNECSQEPVSFIYVHESWIIGNQTTDILRVAQANEIQKF